SVNDVPVANDDAATTDEDTPVVIPVLTNDSDIDGDALAVSIITAPANGSATVNANGSVTYAPAANYHGPDRFSYAISDGQGGLATGVVSITIAPVNDAPQAADDSYTTNEDTTLSVAAPGVRANDVDVDGDSLTLTVTGGPSHGTLTLNQDGSFGYVPAANFSGSDTFTYVLNDGSVDSAPATVTITINPVNDAPVAINDNVATNEDAA